MLCLLIPPVSMEGAVFLTEHRNSGVQRGEQVGNKGKVVILRACPSPPGIHIFLDTKPGNVSVLWKVVRS